MEETLNAMVDAEEDEPPRLRDIRQVQRSPRRSRDIIVGAIHPDTGNECLLVTRVRAQDSYQKALTTQREDALASNNPAYVLLEHGGDVNTIIQAPIRRLSRFSKLRLDQGQPNHETYHLHLGLVY